MTRCPLQMERSRGEAKRQELTRDEQHASLPLNADELIRTLGPGLFRLSSPEELSARLRPFIARLSLTQLEVFADHAEGRYGTAFCRQAGLPVGTVKLSIAS